jgi:DNA-binding SARP family transcriptional activator
MAIFHTEIGAIRLEFLGGGRAISGDGEVILPAGIPFTLLAYVYQSPSGVSRDTLATLFWPGRDRTLGLQSLRQTLTRIRRAVGEDGIKTDGRIVSVDPRMFRSDLEGFGKAIEEGNAAEALALWKGEFLSEARHPECWELEDWLERERGRYRGMLVATLITAAEDAQRLPSLNPETLALFDSACKKLPLEDHLQLLRAELNLKAGLLARTAGFLEELRKLDSPDLPLAQLEADLVEARALASAGKGRPWAELQDLEDLPFPQNRGRQPWLLSLGVGLILLALMGIQSGWFKDKGPPAADLADHIAFYCSTAGTFRIGNPELNLYRMDLDGRNKQRVSDRPGCGWVWLDEISAGILVTTAHPETSFWMMTPNTNSITEWTTTPLAARPDAFTVLDFELHGDPSQVADRYVVFRGKNAADEIALFLLDPLADTIRQVTPAGPWYRTPIWDPAREALIFGAEVEGSRSLWTLRVLDGEASMERLTESPSQDARPALSGDQLLFVRGWGTGPTEGDYNIHLLNRSTGEEEILVERPWNDFMPRWAPDGTHFCWTSEEFGHFESDIWVMEIETRAKRNLTVGLKGRNYECRWGPDSRTVIFSSTGDGRAQIYRALRNGRFLENISRSEAEAEPSWVLPRSVIDRFAP